MPRDSFYKKYVQYLKLWGLIVFCRVHDMPDIDAYSIGGCKLLGSIISNIT